MTSAKFLPDFAIRDGFVVTPQMIPMSFAFLMSNCRIYKKFHNYTFLSILSATELPPLLPARFLIIA